MARPVTAQQRSTRAARSWPERSRRAAATAAATAAALLVAAACGSSSEPPAPLAASPLAASPAPRWASLDEMLAASTDLWGEAALREPLGPSYEQFAALLPPLRFVNAAFGEVPIVLADPHGGPKVRVAGDGSGVALRADHPSWHDSATPPITFWVEESASAATTDAAPPLASLTAAPDAVADAGSSSMPHWRPFGRSSAPPHTPPDAPPHAPALRDGWLPIVTFSDPSGAALELLLLPSDARPSSPTARAPTLRLQVAAGDRPLRFAVEFGGPAEERSFCSDGWQQKGPDGRLVELAPHQRATLGLRLEPTTPAPATPASEPEPAPLAPTSEPDLADADATVERDWRTALGGEFVLETPEPRVNEAWRATLAGILQLFDGDTLNYSAQNFYALTFQAECGDALRALWRYAVPDTERGLDPLLARPLQQGIEAFDVGFKAQLLREWWQLERGRLAAEPPAADRREHAPTRGSHDEEEARWRSVSTRARARALAVAAQVDAWLARRTPAGLLPKQAYCGDLATPVDNLHTNAAFWRGLVDLAHTLEELDHADDQERVARYRTAAAELRTRLHAAVDASVQRDVEPPFVPMALFGAERAYPLLTASTFGSYWNLVSPYAAGSGLFALGDDRLRWLIDYPARHGGLCMGLVRFDQHSGLFANTEGVDDLYTLRRVETLLALDRPDEVVVAFYGKLAQGMTPGSWISGEGSSLRPLAIEGRGVGRATYLPPNSAGSALFLSMLRGMVVHELDRDDDQRPDALRLGHATPRRWLAGPGARLRLAGAPTAFGPVGFEVEVAADGRALQGSVTTPPVAPPSLSLRLRLPEGVAIERAWTIEAAAPAQQPLPLPLLDATTIDFSGRRGTTRFAVSLQGAGLLREP